MSWSLALRLMWRDLRASPHLLWIVAAVAFGVATLAAVGTTRDAVLSTLQADAAVLLGGDVALTSAGAPIPEDERGFIPTGARVADIVTLNTRIARPDGEALTVALKGVDGAYPLYGTARLDPPIAIGDALRDRGLIVAPGVIERLDVQVGATVRLGDLPFTVRAVLISEPDRTGGAFRIGPRVVAGLSDIGAAGLLREGSVARYATRLALPPASDAERFVARLQTDLPDARFQVQSASSAQDGVQGVIGRLATFLTLASLAALATGGLGIALAARTHLAGKLATMATLRALGGPPRWVARLYAAQIALLGLVGVLLGVAGGALAPLMLVWLPAGLLPFDVRVGLSPAALLMAAAVGMLVLALFTWLPLARAGAVTPASLFRGGTDLTGVGAPVRDRLIAGALAIALVALVVVTTDDRRLALIVLAALAAGVVALLALVVVLQRLAARLAGVVPPRWRLPLRELARPGGETTPTVLALALGLTLLVLVGQTGRIIDEEIARQVPARSPSTIFIDIQPPMREPFVAVVDAARDAAILEMVPYLRARLVRIAGVPVGEVTIGAEAAWTTRRDRAITWSRTAPDGERLVAGAWWPDDYVGPPLVAIEDEAAVGYGVGIGDTLSFNVLGRVVEAEIAAIRPEIDWSRGRLDFLFTFSPGVLEAAPYSYIASVDVAPGDRPRLLEAIGEAVPTVTPLFIDEAIAAAATVLDRVRAAVGVVAALTLVSGIVVIAAGLTAVRARQRHAAAVLKALGARRADLVRTFLVEHAGVGAVAALAAVVIGLLGAWLIARLALGLPFFAAPLVIGGIIVAGLLVTTLGGLIGLARLTAQPVQPLLRAG